jgi:hypothetical protein
MKTYEEKLQELKLRLETLEVEYAAADTEWDKLDICHIAKEIDKEIALLEQML